MASKDQQTKGLTRAKRRVASLLANLMPPGILHLYEVALHRRPPMVTSSFTKHQLSGEGFEIGDYTYGTPIVLGWGEGRRLKIGKFCSIAGGVIIFLGGNHRVDWVTTYPFVEFPEEWPKAKGITGHPVSKGDVVIGNDVWIGYGATILSGVRVGDGAVIGAMAVVAGDVEPYSIVAGNSARLVRKRFDEETIDRLLQIRWWDWPLERIRDNVGILMSGDVSALVGKPTDSPD